MPLVAHTSLPTFHRLLEEGETVTPLERALHQDIRELHIGLLNMMPDAALEATERQFFRLVGESNQIAQFYMHPFTIDSLPRGPRGHEHVERHYERFGDLQRDGLDALIITGANVTQPDLSQEPFWRPLIEVIDWAVENVTSVLCSCLATHAVMQFRYGQKRRPLGFKRWGVFPHHVVERMHPLVNDVNTLFDVPHSRFNDVGHDQFAAAGLKVLVDSPVAGVHLAVSEDLFKVVFFQGHPEYDTISLLKEYKREVGRYARGEREDYPPVPDNYFNLQVQGILTEHREQVMAAKASGTQVPELPEHLIVPTLHNTWHDTAEAVIGNWIGKVYQLTNRDRKLPLMDGIDPEDPLGLRGVI
ncbi:MAG: homoserine O-succinyltransferase [Gammaproteobacteria bacterium]|jgi:homoserine O-succinyltransferase|nr:homoserine O-succinyltransferase [Gammaproteobacteria bacterium]